MIKHKGNISHYHYFVGPAYRKREKEYVYHPVALLKHKNYFSLLAQPSHLLKCKIDFFSVFP